MHSRESEGRHLLHVVPEEPGAPPPAAGLSPSEAEARGRSDPLESGNSGTFLRAVESATMNTADMGAVGIEPTTSAL
jgi:hypothetical protein